MNQVSMTDSRIKKEIKYVRALLLPVPVCSRVYDITPITKVIGVFCIVTKW